MPAPMPTYLPWLMTACFGWMYYRRLRRHFGWQPWQPRRTLARIVILALVAAMLGLAAAFVPHVAAGMAVGALAGIALGWFGLKHTRFDAREGRRHGATDAADGTPDRRRPVPQLPRAATAFPAMVRLRAEPCRGARHRLGLIGKRRFRVACPSGLH